MRNPAALSVLEPSAAPAQDMVHVVCIYCPNRALCGTDVTNEPWTDEDRETTCSECDLVETEHQVCPFCGDSWAGVDD